MKESLGRSKVGGSNYGKGRTDAKKRITEKHHFFRKKVIFLLKLPKSPRIGKTGEPKNIIFYTIVQKCQIFQKFLQKYYFGRKWFSNVAKFDPNPFTINRRQQ